MAVTQVQIFTVELVCDNCEEETHSKSKTIKGAIGFGKRMKWAVGIPGPMHPQDYCPKCVRFIPEAFASLNRDKKG